MRGAPFLARKPFSVEKETEHPLTMARGKKTNAAPANDEFWNALDRHNARGKSSSSSSASGSVFTDRRVNIILIVATVLLAWAGGVLLGASFQDKGGRSSSRSGRGRSGGRSGGRSSRRKLGLNVDPMTLHNLEVYKEWSDTSTMELFGGRQQLVAEGSHEYPLGTDAAPLKFAMLPGMLRPAEVRTDIFLLKGAESTENTHTQHDT